MSLYFFPANKITISNKLKENGEKNYNGISIVEYDRGDGEGGRGGRRKEKGGRCWWQHQSAKMVLVLEEVMAKEEETD